MATGWTAQRMRRDLSALAYLTVPFVALAMTFLAIGKFGGSGGWEALDYLLYAMATGALWAAVVVGYLVWVVIRDGWQPSSYPAAAVLAILLALAAGWAYRGYAEDKDCRAAQAFYERLPALPAADRTAAIRDGGRHVSSPSGCSIEALRLALGRGVRDPGPSSQADAAERRATLAELLEAGLPPDHRVLYGYAVEDADPASVRLLLRWRKLLNGRTGAAWEMFPDDIVQPLITYARIVPGQPPDPTARRYRATLAVFVEEAAPDPAALSGWTRDALVDLGLLAP